MEKKPSAIDVRIKRQQEKLLEALAESGNVSFACKKAGVSRDTYYRWFREGVCE
jgi:molybdenum-dependent DNA-binding transcriptional regulator ModE